MGLTVSDILSLPDSAQKRAMLAQLRHKPDPNTIGDSTCEKVMVSHAMELKTGPNARLHRMERARLVKLERKTAWSLVRSLRQHPLLPVVVKLTRVGRKPMDDDNLRGAFKAIRDGIADVWGISDDDERIKFVYAQNVGNFEPAVWIDINRVPARPAGGTRP